MSSLNDLLEAIASIQTGITNGTSTVRPYPYPEYEIPAAHLPFFVNLPDRGTLELLSMGGTQQTNPGVNMHLCIKPRGLGERLSVNVSEMASWFDAVNDQFLLHLRLGAGLAWVRLALIDEWDFEAFTWGATEYHAVRFHLQVQGDWIKTLGETTR